ncbi:4'-phosphopantetheinyl transferase superfamily protein [Flavitalea sp. BT771]|uniref:4'-phosphopantetheinyl transferase family protein n=1 Tax=Flavitalea sp. BT771 TaxID=3063329 RepID=UPI0026E27F90|nr:4'-phosphopantetheinyl transferase superfamily protein [Flavitalea sp. BT771]MDO6434635.1 4'-phosphopantetheinyl transferase superfamily protein [Flavitalea sp. BT771]MDV6223535.1 4'-phosphopantetheinyl transferase superfamily protein [Flavitalea sp. BT771]
MSIWIYSTEYKTPIPENALQSLIAGLPPEISAKARRFRRWQDAHGCLLGKLLLTTALKVGGWPADLRHLQYTDYGRPFLSGGPDFNISHSGHRVVCILATEGGVGIDLEEIKDLNIEDFKGQFSADEWATITGAPHPLKAFYHFWTAKECLSKADGRGLNLPLAGLRIEENRIISLGSRHWRLQALPLSAGYACHIAAESPMDHLALKELSLRDLADQSAANYFH